MFRKGRPDSIVSDRGSQLVAAGIVLANKDSPSNQLDWKKVTSVNSATDWKFVPIGGQHRNGLSEESCPGYTPNCGAGICRVSHITS